MNRHTIIQSREPETVMHDCHVLVWSHLSLMRQHQVVGGWRVGGTLTEGPNQRRASPSPSPLLLHTLYCSITLIFSVSSHAGQHSKL